MGDMSEYHSDPVHTPKPKATTRVFFAHPKNFSDTEIAAWTAALRAYLAARGIEATVTPGRDDFEAHFPRCGSSWDAWTADVATGIHPVTREPRYTHIILPGARCGMGTAKIVQLALAHGKKVAVFVMQPEAKLTRATTIVKVGPSAQIGWEVR